MSAAKLIAAARRSLGMSGRPNPITREYAARNGKEYLRASWCDMAVTYWARHSGNASAVLPGGDRAYTVWHVDDFKKAGRWRAGTASAVDRARPGDIVFFDWGGSNRGGAVDHVGVVEKVLGGGRLQTIEANTGDAVRRRVRAAGVIAGYGRPAYGSGWMEDAVKDLPTISKGARGSNEAVQTARGLLLARSHPEVGTRMDRDFDATMDKAVRAVQKWARIETDGIIGPDTWSVLLRVH